MKTLLITGASGFLGYHLVLELLKNEQNQVIAIVGRSKDKATLLLDHKRLKVYPCDSLFSEEWKDVDTVIHCAFPRSNDAKDLADAIDYTERAIHQYESMGVASIINISSQGVYRRLDADYLSNEESPIQPIDMYSMVKYATEKMFSLSSVPCVTNIRLASLMMPQRFLYYFVRKIKEGQNLMVTAPNQYAALLDVDDAARGIAAVVSLPHLKRATVYNLGINTHYSLLEYAESVKAIGRSFGYSADFEVIDNGTNACAGMDCTKLINDTGWKPIVSKDEMIRKLFKEI